MKPLHVLHGGKGTHMDIVQMEGNFEYYLVFYQAAIPFRELKQSNMLERFHVKTLFKA